MNAPSPLPGIRTPSATRRHLLAPGAALGLLVLATTAQGQVLYDPALGTLPSAQGWSYASLPLAAQVAVNGGATVLNTTALSQILAGFSRVAPTPLDRGTGFSLAFSLRVNSEDHGSRVDRAGVSVTVLGSDRKGIELGFWADRVWAQSDSPMFVHAEEVLFNTTAATAEYRLTVQGDTYSLTADGQALLTGPVRDYTPFVGTIDPYETPNFLFIGDNTTSARASMALGKVELLPLISEPPALSVEALAGIFRISWPVTPEAWALEGAENLSGAVDWQPVSQTVETADGRRRVDVPASGDVRFFRLRR